MRVPHRGTKASAAFWRNSLGAPQPNVKVRETVGTTQQEGNMRSIFVCLVLACSMGGASASAQTSTSASSQEVQQLQDKIQQLEQLTQELKNRLAAVEKSQSGAPQVVNANIVGPNNTGEAAPSPASSQTTQTTQT